MLSSSNKEGRPSSPAQLLQGAKQWMSLGGPHVIVYPTVTAVH